MTKLMVFIDGTWLYHSKFKLSEAAGSEDYALDYGKLPHVVAGEVARRLPGREADVVRTYLFGSCAWNYDPRDEDVVQRQKDFFAMLKEKYHYELDVYPIDFRGRRLRRADRGPDDHFEPRERCVNIALASSLLYYAALPNAYDVAVLVLGDQDFVPALQAVRRLGKRVAIASIKASCCQELSDPYDEARVKDFDIVWLDDLVDRLELNNGRHRNRHVQTQQFEEQDWSPSDDDDDDADLGEDSYSYGSHDGAGLGEELPGLVKTTFDDRGYGFIHGLDGQDYFFHITDLLGGLEFHEMADGLPVMFQVKKEPEYDKAGAARNVRIPLPGEVEQYESEAEETASV